MTMMSIMTMMTMTTMHAHCVFLANKMGKFGEGSGRVVISHFSTGDPNFLFWDHFFQIFHFGTIFYVGWLGQPYFGWEWLRSVREVPLGTPNFRYLLVFCHFGAPRAQKIDKNVH